MLNAQKSKRYTQDSHHGQLGSAHEASLSPKFNFSTTPSGDDFNSTVGSLLQLWEVYIQTDRFAGFIVSSATRRQQHRNREQVCIYQLRVER
jgi:hypothetical protein